MALAEKAYRAAANDAMVLDSLAAAYAAAGRFEAAVATAEKALSLAHVVADEIRSRLALYRRGKAYRAPTP